MGGGAYSKALASTDAARWSDVWKAGNASASFTLKAVMLCARLLSVLVDDECPAGESEHTRAGARKHLEPVSRQIHLADETLAAAAPRASASDSENPDGSRS